VYVKKFTIHDGVIKKKGKVFVSRKQKAFLKFLLEVKKKKMEKSKKKNLHGPLVFYLIYLSLPYGKVYLTRGP
jgi:hypothetical protein